MVLWRRIPVWPLLLILACLFAVSLDAARIWGAESREAADPKRKRPGQPHRAQRLILPSGFIACRKSWPAFPRPAIRAYQEQSSHRRGLLPRHRSLAEFVDAADAETSDAKARAEDFWHEPETLIENLGGLAGTGPAGKWAAEVLRQIRALGPAVVAGSKTSTAILQRLVALDREVPELAAQTPDWALAHKLRKVGFALGRRIDIWQQIVELRMHRAPGAAAPELDSKKLAECLAQIEAITGDSPEGQAWREYLLIDALKECAARRPSPDDSGRGRLPSRH